MCPAQTPALLVVEDDLLFAPDFMEYFRAVAPVLEEDDSLFVVSAWNDNGFRDVVADPVALRRTEYFPGLGWLLPRRLFFDEVRPCSGALDRGGGWRELRC